MSSQTQISIDAEKLVDDHVEAVIDYKGKQHDAKAYILVLESREKLVDRIGWLEWRVKELSDFAKQVITDNEDSPYPEDAHVNLGLLSDDAKAILGSNK